MTTPTLAAARRSSPMAVGEAAGVSALLLLGYLFMTVGADWRYSVDLQVLNDVVAIYPFPDDLLSAIIDNSALVWLVLKFSWLATPETLLQVIYVTAFALKTSVLLRYFGLLPTLAFTTLLFFSIDLNQARMSIALSLMVLAWSAEQRRAYVTGCLLALLAAACHYPGTAVFALFYLAGRHPKMATIAIVLATFAGVALILSPESPALRYLAYLESDGDDGSAFFFVVTALLTMLYWGRLSPLQRTIAAIATGLAFATRDLVNLSGRVSELAAMAVMLCAFASPVRRKEALNADQASMVIAVLFFAYRFTQWVVMGQVPLPSNL